MAKDPYEEISAQANDPYASISAKDKNDPYASIAVSQQDRTIGEQAVNMAKDVGVEAGISLAGQGAGAALAPFTLGISYPVLSAAGGFTGSIARQRQQIERGDLEKISYGDAVASAVINILPFGKTASLAGTVARDAGKIAIGQTAKNVATTVAKAGATRAVQGAAVGAGTAVSMKAFDEGKMPFMYSAEDVADVIKTGAQYAALGGTLGVSEPVLGTAVKSIMSRMKGKTPSEAVEILDQIASSGTPDEKVAASAIRDTVGVRMGLVAESEPKSALDSAVAFANAESTISAKTASDAADVLANSPSIRRAQDFDVARTESALMEVKDRQLAGPEEVSLGDNPFKNQQTILDTRPGDAIRERARLDPNINPPEPPTSYNAADAADLSPQASRILDEYGRTSLNVMAPIAGGAGGAAYGVTQGETPEERLSNALKFGAIGAGVGATPFILSKAVDKPDAFVDGLRKQIATVTAGRVLGREVTEVMRNAGWATEAARDLGVRINRDFNAAIKASDNPALTTEALGRFIEGDAAAINDIPKQFRGTVQYARNRIDQLSREYLAIAPLSDALREKIDSNIGRYLTREYSIFTDEAYKPSIEAKTNLRNFLVRERGVSPEEATNLVTTMENKANREALGGFLLGNGQIAGKDVGILIARKDLAPEVVEFLGPITDPGRRVAGTMAKLGNLVANERMHMNLRNILLESGMASTQSDFSTFTKELVSPSDQRRSALTGLFVSEKVKDAFDSWTSKNLVAAATNPLLKGVDRLFIDANALSKATKTITNPEGYMPQLWGGMLNAVAQGRVSYSDLKRGFVLAAEDNGLLRSLNGKVSVDRVKLTSELERAKSLGLWDREVDAKELARATEDGLLRRVTAPILEPAAKAWSVFDNSIRYMVWRSTVKETQEIFPDMAMDQAEKYAADLTRQSFFNYDYVPNVMKGLSRRGIVSPFINFPYEVFRTTANQAAIAKRYIVDGQKTGNIAMYNAGLKRALTLGATLGGTLGVNYAWNRMQGLNEQQTEALNEIITPDFDKRNMLMFDYDKESMKGAYVNQNYVNPSALAVGAYYNIMAAPTAEEGVKRAAEFLQDTFIGQPGGTVMRPLFEAALNAKAGGRGPVSLTSDPAERAKYFLDQAFTPLILKNVENFGRAARGEKGASGEVYTMEDRVARLAGLRYNRFDLPTQLEFRARNLSNQWGNVIRSYSSALNRDLGAQAIDDAYAKAEADRQKVFSSLVKFYNSAKVLDLPDDTIISSMKNAGLGNELILNVIEGQYVPGSKDRKATASDIWESIEGQSRDVQKEFIEQYATVDRNIATALRDRLRSDYRASALGYDSKDALITGLGVSDGSRARYFRRTMDQIKATQGEQAAARYLDEMAQKRLVPPEVRRQLIGADPINP